MCPTGYNVIATQCSMLSLLLRYPQKPGHLDTYVCYLCETPMYGGKSLKQKAKIHSGHEDVPTGESVDNS